MESFSHHSLNRNNVVAKLSECIESFVGHCHSAISCIASKVAQLKNRLAIVATPRRNSIVKLDHLHKSYNKVKDNNYALSGLLGFDLHNKVAGIIGTGKIGNPLLRQNDREYCWLYQDPRGDP